MPAENWLRSQARPLQTVEPGSGFHDLRAFDELVADKRVVVLCEASHGAREIYLLKHRLIEYLVTQHGFNEIAITCGLPEAMSLNDPDVRIADAIGSLRWWTLDTTEVAALVAWARSLPVPISGVDTGRPSSGLHRLFESTNDQRIPRLPAVTDTGSTLHHLLPETKATKTYGFINGLSCDDPVARTLKQFLPRLEDPARGYEIKDASCAENILALLGPNKKVVVWTHAGHGMRTSFDSPTIGSHLQKALGSQLAIIGTAFGSGSFQAVEVESGRLRDFEMEPPEAGTLDEALSRAHAGIVDLRNAPPTVALPTRWTGDAYSTDRRARLEYYVHEPCDLDHIGLDPRDCYDALVFVPQISACRRNHEIPPRDPSFDRGLSAWPHSRAGNKIWRRGAPVTWGDGVIKQTWPVSPGKVRCEVSVTCRGESPCEGAQVYLRTARQAALTPLVREASALQLSLELETEEDRVSVGLVMAGNGRADFSDLVVTPNN